MSAHDNGGPAFPTSDPNYEQKYAGEGMYLRDYFAAKALAVMCASNVNATGTFSTFEGRATVAKVCYWMADAMMKARNA